LLPQDRGRRECRVLAATHGPPAAKKAGDSYHRFSRSSGIPCAMVLTLIARSPREPGFLAPVIARLIAAQLDLSVGRPGPRAFTSAPAPFVRTRNSRAVPMRPSHPRLTCRDDRDTSHLHRGGMARIILLIYRILQRLRPTTNWHDGQFAHGVHAKLARRAIRVTAKACNGSRASVPKWVRHCWLYPDSCRLVHHEIPAAPEPKADVSARCAPDAPGCGV